MMNMPVSKGCVWVDLGGGTASNVEFFSKSVMTDWFASVHVVDLTPSLVKVAKKRVEDNKWGGKVRRALGHGADLGREGPKRERERERDLGLLKRRGRTTLFSTRKTLVADASAAFFALQPRRSRSFWATPRTPTSRASPPPGPVTSSASLTPSQ